jgi:filamentous hemagglutinin family protein
MKSSIVHLINICLYSIGFICVSNKISLAQVTSDNTVNTQVNQNGNVAEITGGETKGSNLFHSFQEFSIPTGNEAFFNNESAIANIFSRVTGNTVSQINGLIRANGNANLFLINPAGIIFNENASLDIGGSFLATTANSIQFNDGDFSAIAPGEKPILTISVPIGLSFDENPGEIINNSEANERRGLEVATGNNITLLGGNISFESGTVTAPGGIVNLGGLTVPGLIAIREDGSLTFPEDVAKADITLSNGAVTNVRNTGGGKIAVNARNLELTESSELRAGIASDSASNNAQAGDIEINLTDNLNLNNSNITNTVQAEGVGNSGNINITTGSIKATNRGQVDTNTFGKGNGGDINITATSDIIFDGENNNLESSVISLVIPGAEGNAGDITISTQGKLTFANGGRVDASTSARGNGGNINLTAVGDITFDGEDLEQLGSGATSLVNPKAVGDAGDIIISTGGNLTLANRGRVEANNNGSDQGNGGNVSIDVGGNLTVDGEKNSKGFGSNIGSLVNNSATGDSGNIAISTGGNLTLSNEGQVIASNSATGNSGNITISTGGNLTLSNEGQVIASSSATGNSGNITISTGGNLTSSSGGKIDTNINAQGNGGDITIDAMGDITFEGEDFNGDGSGATSLVGEDGSGNAGNITISTQGKLSLTDGGRVDASSNRGQGNAGSVDITATDDIFFEGEDSRGFGSGATSQANPGVEAGNAGGITISTGGNLTFKNGGRVDTSTNAPGDAGSVKINALGDVTFEGKALNGDGSGATSQVNPEAKGNAGGVTISTEGNLTLKDGGRVDVSINSRENTGRTNADINLQVAENLILDNSSLISAKASENANGGNLDIDSRFIIAFPNGNSDIVASAEQGQGGNIMIDAKSVFGIEERPLNNSTNDINASSELSLDGTVVINTPDINLQRELEQSELKLLTAEQAIANSCLARSNQQASLTVGSNGGLPKSSNFHYSDANFSLTGVGSLPIIPEKAALTQKNQALIPAEKMVETQDGRIFLVASPKKAEFLLCPKN